MGDHIHGKGEWMLSYRFMTMEMQGNLQGSQDIDPDTIVTTEPNRFFGMPNMPPTLRIVPQDMQMDMHMLGFMYAPSERLTLMFMANYLDKSMNHTTYAGGMGENDARMETAGYGVAHNIYSLIRQIERLRNLQPQAPIKCSLLQSPPARLDTEPDI